jgi:hypothetical protein
MLSVASGTAPALAATPTVINGASIHSSTFLSESYPIDRIYRSMKGPQSSVEVVLQEPSFPEPESKPELLWITGFHADVVQDGSNQTALPGYMCHSNLGFAQMPRHRELFKLDVGGRRRGRLRMFTLSQGQMEVSFPAGFGLPLVSDEKLLITTQVLNLNAPRTDIRVRHKTTVSYLRDSELSAPMKPLLQKAAQGMVLIAGKDAYFNIESADPAKHGPGCAIGERAGGRILSDDFGRKFSPHWTVPPGTHENRTLVTRWMDLPFDTTIHHIAVHLHPFAKSLELRDLTTNTTVFASEAEASRDGIGLDSVGSFSSDVGIPVYADHHYELVSVYENTSSEVQDSMAIMFLYMLDQEFIRPELN